MTATAAETVGETVGARLAGERPSRAKAVLMAGMAGVAAAVLTYRLLRSDREPE
jgi:hypothetical protein